MLNTSSAGAQEIPDPHKSEPAWVEFISDDETDEDDDENEEDTRLFPDPVPSTSSQEKSEDEN